MTSSTNNSKCNQEELRKEFVYATSYDIFSDRNYDEKIYTKKQVEKIIQRFSDIDIQYATAHPHLFGGTKIPLGEGDRQERIRMFYRSLEHLVKIYRDGKYHNPLCEYAKGDSCSCWCSEKYHGMMGVVAQ